MDDLLDSLLDELGDDLKAQGLTFEQMMADSAAIRQEIYDTKYAPKESNG